MAIRKVCTYCNNKGCRFDANKCDKFIKNIERDNYDIKKQHTLCVIYKSPGGIKKDSNYKIFDEYTSDEDLSNIGFCPYLNRKTNHNYILHDPFKKKIVRDKDKKIIFFSGKALEKLGVCKKRRFLCESENCNILHSSIVNNNCSFCRRINNLTLTYEKKIKKIMDDKNKLLEH